MERLEPFEKLENDYYLGERDGWYSDDENRDSEGSGDDDFRQKISNLASIQGSSKARSTGARCEKAEKKDDFESDMDDDLDERLVAHASQFMTSASSKVSSSFDEKIEEKPTSSSTVPDYIEDSMDFDSENLVSILKTETSSGNSQNDDSAVPGSGRSLRKKVTIKDEPMVIENADNENEEVEKKCRTAFDDKDNLLRKAADKLKDEVKAESVEFYDSDEDEDNERWVRQHRERLRIIPHQTEESRDKSGNETWEKDSKKYDNNQTDAVLSCPACMTLLTRDCQRHDVYKNQYRAIFVENCKVVTDKVLFLPQTGVKKSKMGKKRKEPGVKRTENLSPSDLEGIPKEDLFHPVQCCICSLNVGVYDHDEIYHFFDVLTGYA